MQRARRRRRPVRRRDQRRRRAGRHRPRRPAVRSPSTSAGWPRCGRWTCRRRWSPWGRACAGRRWRTRSPRDGPEPRPPAAELGVRHPRWLRGHPVGRAVLHRRRPLRRPRRGAHARHAVRGAGARATRRPRRPGPDLLGLALGSEGTLGVITELRTAGAADAVGERLRGLGVPLVGRGAGRARSGWPATTCCPTSSRPSRPGRDPRQPAHGRRRRCAGAARHAEGPPARGRLHARGRLGGVASAGPRAVAGRRPRCSGRACGAAGAAGSGSRGASTGSPAPYLRDRLLDAGPAGGDRWRPRPPGRRCPPSTTPSAGPCGSPWPADGRPAAGHDATSRTATRPAPRCTCTVLGRPRRRPADPAVADRQAGGHRRAAGRRRARSPTTTPSAPTTARGWSARSGRSASRCCARSSSAWTPTGICRPRRPPPRRPRRGVPPCEVSSPIGAPPVQLQNAWPKLNTPSGSTGRLHRPQPAARASPAGRPRATSSGPLETSPRRLMQSARRHFQGSSALRAPAQADQRGPPRPAPASPGPSTSSSHGTSRPRDGVGHLRPAAGRPPAELSAARRSPAAKAGPGPGHGQQRVDRLLRQVTPAAPRPRCA